MSSNATHERTILQQRDLKLRIATYVVSILITILVLSPFIILFTTAEPGKKSELVRLITNPAKRLGKYWKDISLFCQSELILNFYNSIIVSVISTAGCMYVSAIAAYGLTAYEWKLKKPVENFIIICMMIPTVISTIGYYQFVCEIGMINHLSMVIMPAIASPITVFFMRMYLQSTFSKELVESGRLDGASEFRIFNQIILPLMKPAIATQLIFCFSKVWYDQYVPAIILLENDKKTLPITWNIYVKIPEVFFFLPPIIVYIFCSKNIIEGVALGSVKY